MLKLCRIAALTAFYFLPVAGFVAAGCLLATAQPAPLPTYELQATDNAGNLYIAGSGHTCGLATINAIYPANMQSLACVRVR